MTKRIKAETAKDGWTVVRIKRSLLERASEIGEKLGGSGATYVVERAVEDLLKMAETPPGQRRVPMLVRLIDATRDEAAALLSEEASAPAPAGSSSHRRGAMRVGQG